MLVAPSAQPKPISFDSSGQSSGWSQRRDRITDTAAYFFLSVRVFGPKAFAGTAGGT